MIGNLKAIIAFCRVGSLPVHWSHRNGSLVQRILPLVVVKNVVGWIVLKKKVQATVGLLDGVEVLIAMVHQRPALERVLGNIIIRIIILNLNC
jgi:hypothetical protein